MIPNNMDIPSIEKEDVANCHFPHEEVLSNAQEIKTRATNIKNAEALGNIEHHKISIVFEDDKGKHVVTTTVWAAGEDHIVLKKGVIIPISRIHEINLL